MNRDLTVFTVLALLLGLDAFGALELLPVISRNAGGLTGEVPLILIAAFSSAALVLSVLSFLVARKIFTRIN